MHGESAYHVEIGSELGCSGRASAQGLSVKRSRLDRWARTSVAKRFRTPCLARSIITHQPQLLSLHRAAHCKDKTQGY